MVLTGAGSKANRSLTHIYNESRELLLDMGNQPQSFPQVSISWIGSLAACDYIPTTWFISWLLMQLSLCRLWMSGKLWLGLLLKSLPASVLLCMT